jgi:hypothetical protein
MLTKTKKHKKDKASTDMDEEFLDMNVFDMLTGKHKKIVINNDDDSMSITNNLFHFEQTNEPYKRYLNNKNKYDEIAYPFSRRTKLKHETEADPEKKPVQYTAGIIVEIKNRGGTVVPMRALLDTGTTPHLPLC